MNRKTTIIAAVIVLLIGAGAVAVMLNGNTSTGGEPTTADGATPRTRNSDNGAFEPNNATKTSARQDERETRDAELVAEYGEARTNLSRHVVGNVVSLLDDAVEMGELMTNGGGGGFGGGNWAARGITRSAGVELNEEQQAQFKEIHAEFQKREIEKSKEAVASLKDNPSTLMSLLLASDARSRDEISEDDYASLQASSLGDLENIINPLDRKNFRGGDALGDPVFRSQFEAMLDPEQAEIFGTKMTEKDAAAEESQEPGRDITNLPVMDLETLDSTIGSAQKMTSGFKQVMEGMGGLGPIMEQQRQKNEGSTEGGAGTEGSE